MDCCQLWQTINCCLTDNKLLSNRARATTVSTINHRSSQVWTSPPEKRKKQIRLTSNTALRMYVLSLLVSLMQIIWLHATKTKRQAFTLVWSRRSIFVDHSKYKIYWWPSFPTVGRYITGVVNAKEVQCSKTMIRIWLFVTLLCRISFFVLNLVY